MQTTLQSKLTMTYEQFLQWKNEDTHAEWVNGEVILFMPPKTFHQVVITFLTHLLDAYVQVLGNGVVLTAPCELFLPQSNASREPDVFVVLGNNLQNLSEDRFSGAPDLVVEVISDDSVNRDRVEKFLEYEREGVREYWVVDPRPGRKAIDVFVLEHGSFVPLSVNEDGWIESKALPGFRVKEAWFTADRLPNPLAALGELLPAEMRQQIVRQINPPEGEVSVEP